MAFQRARNEKQVEARRLEIRKAVEKLYSDGCLANVTFTNISKLKDGMTVDVEGTV